MADSPHKGRISDSCVFLVHINDRLCRADIFDGLDFNFTFMGRRPDVDPDFNRFIYNILIIPLDPVYYAATPYTDTLSAARNAHFTDLQTCI